MDNTHPTIQLLLDCGQLVTLNHTEYVLKWVEREWFVKDWDEDVVDNCMSVTNTIIGAEHCAVLVGETNGPPSEVLLHTVDPHLLTHPKWGIYDASHGQKVALLEVEPGVPWSYVLVEQYESAGHMALFSQLYRLLEVMDHLLKQEACGSLIR